jgi:catechol 2,3-dioxygenase-like lactoylglutathione lyase family enzyme
MIQKMSHAPIWVLDQDEARDFYTQKLGFELKNDVAMDDGFRWVTVCPPGQPDFEIILMSAKPGPHMDAETAAAFESLIRSGKMGAGVFSTPDCRKTYEELKAKGVEFTKEPSDEFYAVEAIFKDNSGNWFSLGQEK